MRKKKEIDEYMNEAFDIVWLVRTISLLGEGRLDGTPSDIINEAQKQVARICENLDINSEEELLARFSDWEYGYWSGILAALRWVAGEEKDMLDT
jgi:hypothetical protein